ncbi:MAG: LamG domain-containing protein [Sulfuricaulis sp.]|nr:LamG domain-containing protein [Sulfuricaulis sp.]
MARDFNGTSDLIDIANNAVYDVDNITIAFWAWTDVDVTFSVAFGRDDSSTNRCWNLGIGSAASTFRFAPFIGNSQINAQSGTGFSTGAWHHLVGTYDGSNVRLWVDGVNTATTAQSGTLDKDPVGPTIGGRSGAVQLWDGRVANALIYNRALSGAEIEMVRRGFWMLPGLLGFWPLFGVQSPEPDWSGNNNHGTVTGATRIDHPPGISLWGGTKRIQRVATAPVLPSPIKTIQQAVHRAASY